MLVGASQTAAAVVGDKIIVIGGWKHSNSLPHAVVQIRGDGIVNADDICLMLDYWLTDELLYDIAPRPLGDEIVDIQDLILLAEHLFEEVPPVE